MRLLVTGAGGQVGGALAAMAPCLALTRAELDVTDAARVDRVVGGERPEVIVNCAAYTDVDRAEDEPALAEAVNRDGPAHLAAAADRVGAALVQLSTDFVFDGEKGSDYHESDAPRPLNTYGRSKLAGERAVRDATRRHVVLRTAWVFAPRGRNFVLTMRRLADQGRREISVVADQFGGPTAADDIARAALAIAEVVRGQGFEDWGVYHFSGRPAVSWHGFARAILADRPEVRVSAIGSEAWPTRARRPGRVVLGGDRIVAVFGLRAPDWRPALDATLARIEAEGHSP